MKHLFMQFIGLMTGMGGLGVFLLAALDSSFLFLPFGLDIVLVAASARHEDLSLLYAALATFGSLLGTAIIWVLARKGGEKGLSRFGKEERVKIVSAKIEKRAGWALAFAALMPPPFPYRLFVAAAAVAAFPLAKLLLVAGIARFIRFATEVYLSHRYGEQIVSYMESSDVFQYTMVAIIVVSIVGSVFSIIALFRRRSSQTH